jgi:alkanesulfonate monooxygenase
VDFAQAHEAAGFDMVLVGYTSSFAEGFLVAMHVAARTQRLSYLVAHRPGFVAPTLFARKVATFDQLTCGRVALHVVTGKTDAEQEGDGDFAPKAERYQRAQEYLHLMKRTWTSGAPFDFRAASIGFAAPTRMCAPADAASADHVRRRLGRCA